MGGAGQRGWPRGACLPPQDPGESPQMWRLPAPLPLPLSINCKKQGRGWGVRPGQLCLKCQLIEKRRGGGGGLSKSPSCLEAESGAVQTDGHGSPGGGGGASSQVEAGAEMMHICSRSGHRTLLRSADLHEDRRALQLFPSAVPLPTSGGGTVAQARAREGSCCPGAPRGSPPHLATEENRDCARRRSGIRQGGSRRKPDLSAPAPAP